MNFLKEPSGNAPWVKHAHDQSRDFYGIPVGYCATARGQADWDGTFFTNPRQIVNYPYGEGPNTGLIRLYATVPSQLNHRMHGMAAPLADFWTGALWIGGQPTMQNYGQYIFQPGKTGAEHAVPSLILAQAGQAAEAAYRLDKAGDPGKQAAALLGWSGGENNWGKRFDWAGQAASMKPERVADLELALFNAAAGK